VRTMVLNQSYEFLGILPWFDAFCLVLADKAYALGTYNKKVRSMTQEWDMPAVIITKEYKNTKKRPRAFAASTRNVLIRDNFTCQYCGCKLSLKTGTKDHVLPSAQGGKTTMMNLVAACKPCNGKKDNRTPAQCGMYPMNPPRDMTDEEKLKSVMKTFQSKERNVWLDTLKKHDVTLW
jgi:5-methylcytosine-specific restriction endonuclease McrA